MKGDIDGIDLTKFKVGNVYDMGTSHANYLMAIGYGTPVVDEDPALITPLDEAADRSPRKRPR